MNVGAVVGTINTIDVHNKTINKLMFTTLT